LILTRIARPIPTDRRCAAVHLALKGLFIPFTNQITTAVKKGRGITTRRAFHVTAWVETAHSVYPVAVPATVLVLGGPSLFAPAVGRTRKTVLLKTGLTHAVAAATCLPADTVRWAVVALFTNLTDAVVVTFTNNSFHGPCLVSS